MLSSDANCCVRGHSWKSAGSGSGCSVAADIEHLNPDLVFVAADFQNRGPNPREVTKFVAQS
jgi:hypothetical protein